MQRQAASYGLRTIHERIGIAFIRVYPVGLDRNCRTTTRVFTGARVSARDRDKACVKARRSESRVQSRRVFACGDLHPCVVAPYLE